MREVSESFQGSSKEQIAREVKLAFTEIVEKRKQGLEQLKHRLFALVGKEQQEPRESDIDEFVNLIELYANNTASVEAKQRLRREEWEIEDIDAERHRLHNDMRERGQGLGLDEEEVLQFMEMRVRDRLAEPEIAEISKKAEKALGFPMKVYDNDLTLIYEYGEMGEAKGKRLKDERDSGGYSLVIHYIFRPTDSSILGQSEHDYPYTKEDITSIHRIMDKAAEKLSQQGVTRQYSLSHYCHDMENYPGQDFMAFKFVTYGIQCPKENVDAVIQTIREVREEAKETAKKKSK